MIAQVKRTFKRLKKQKRQALHERFLSPNTCKQRFAEGSKPPFINNHPTPIIGYPLILRILLISPPNFTASPSFSNCIQIHYFNFYKTML